MVCYADIKIAFFPAGGQDQAAHDVVLEGIQHSLGIRRYLDGMDAALPGGLDPEHRLSRQVARLLGEQSGGIVLIGG